MTGFRTFGPGVKKGDFGAMIGVDRWIDDRSNVVTESLQRRLLSESAGEVGISELKKRQAGQ